MGLSGISAGSEERNKKMHHVDLIVRSWFRAQSKGDPDPGEEEE